MTSNALAPTGTPPPMPVQEPAMQNNLQAAPQPQAAGGPPQAAPAPPSHEQTVSALRHFHAVIGEVQTLLKDPETGKSDMKSKIIDGVTKLVSERMIAPGSAVAQLSQVPADPLQQRKWLQTTLQQATQAANAVLDHHAAGSQGTLDWAKEGQAIHPHPDQHMGHMAALEANYGGRK